MNREPCKGFGEKEPNSKSILQGEELSRERESVCLAELEGPEGYEMRMKYAF